MVLRALKSLRAEPERAPFMAFAGDEVTRAILAKLAQERGWSEQSIRDGGIDLAMDTLAGMATPRQLIVDLSGADDPLAAVGALSNVCDAGTQVIALGRQNDVNLYRGLVALGIEDYLPKPVSPEALTQALERIARARAADDGEKEGQMICVIGARGGVGASTVALNAAWIMAHEHAKKTALVDLDIYFGSLSLALDLEPGRGFREALEHADRIDGLFIERAMVRHSENLSLLSAEEELTRGVVIDGDAVDHLFEPLRSTFDSVVIEIPRSDLALYKPVIADAAATIIVSDASLAGLRDTARLAEFVKELGGEDGLRLVLNRLGLLPKAELRPADFARESGLQVAAAVPFLPKIAAESMVAGKPAVVLKKRCKLATALYAVCESILPPEDEEAEPVSFWRRKPGKKRGAA
ncbi:MAG: P-loop NTPase [Rhodospirillales bacterium]